jgi:hypothetical protein
VTFVEVWEGISNAFKAGCLLTGGIIAFLAPLVVIGGVMAYLGKRFDP